MSTTNIPSQDRFDIVLDKTLWGKTVLQNPGCTFSYTWDFSSNTGQATLESIDGTQIGIALFPMGIGGMLAFMSDLKQPAAFTINGQSVVLNRIVLNIVQPSGEKRAGIEFNKAGSTIEVSSNWQQADNAHVETMIRKVNPSLFTK